MQTRLTAAAEWRGGRPARSSRPGSRGSPQPETLSQKGVQDHSVDPDLGEAGCQAITYLYNPEPLSQFFPVAQHQFAHGPVANLPSFVDHEPQPLLLRLRRSHDADPGGDDQHLGTSRTVPEDLTGKHGGRVAAAHHLGIARHRGAGNRGREEEARGVWYSTYLPEFRVLQQSGNSRSTTTERISTPNSDISANTRESRSSSKARLHSRATPSTYLRTATNSNGTHRSSSIKISRVSSLPVGWRRHTCLRPSGSKTSTPST